MFCQKCGAEAQVDARLGGVRAVGEGRLASSDAHATGRVPGQQGFSPRAPQSGCAGRAGCTPRAAISVRPVVQRFLCPRRGGSCRAESQVASAIAPSVSSDGAK